MEPSPGSTYSPSSTALRTLTGSFWTASGWRRGGPGNIPLPTVDDVSAAVRAGVMFSPSEWAVDHDETIGAARAVVGKVDPDAIADGFLSSLVNRRLDLRSALGSYAVLRWLPDHRLERGSSRWCRVCGLPSPSGGPLDRNLLNFERFKWGGVRRDNVAYATFDLTQFLRAPREASGPAHRKVAWSLITALEALAAGTTAPVAVTQLPMVKGNRQEREALLDILGVCGILQTPQHRGYADAFIPYSARQLPALRNVERTYPVCWWRAEDGVDRRNVHRFLPQLF